MKEEGIPYRSPSEPDDARLDRLEAVVKAGRGERMLASIKWGFNGLLLCLGVTSTCYGAAYLIERDTEATRADAEIATEATEEARGHCAEACGANEMSLVRVKTRGALATACVCASDTHERVVLWDDARTAEEAAYGQCTTACRNVGARASRAVLTCTASYIAYRGDRVCTAYRAEACSCNSPQGHRVLWDDRQ